MNIDFKLIVPAHTAFSQGSERRKTAKHQKCSENRTSPANPPKFISNHPASIRKHAAPMRNRAVPMRNRAVPMRNRAALMRFHAPLTHLAERQPSPPENFQVAHENFTN